MARATSLNMVQPNPDLDNFDEARPQAPRPLISRQDAQYAGSDSRAALGRAHRGCSCRPLWGRTSARERGFNPRATGEPAHWGKACEVRNLPGAPGQRRRPHANATWSRTAGPFGDASRSVTDPTAPARRARIPPMQPCGAQRGNQTRLGRALSDAKGECVRPRRSGNPRH